MDEMILESTIIRNDNDRRFKWQKYKPIGIRITTTPTPPPLTNSDCHLSFSTKKTTTIMSSAPFANKMAPTNETSTITSEKEFQPSTPLEGEEDSNGDLPANSNEETSAQYPSGLTLGLIVGSMMMTMFLVAIDQVIIYSSSQYHSNFH